MRASDTFARSAPRRAHFYRSALLFERCGVKVVPYATSRRASPSAFTTCDSTLYGAAMAAVQQCGMCCSAIKARLSLSARFVPLTLDPYQAFSDPRDFPYHTRYFLRRAQGGSGGEGGGGSSVGAGLPSASASAPAEPPRPQARRGRHCVPLSNPSLRTHLTLAQRPRLHI